MVKFDGELDIATGVSAKSKNWTNKRVKWSALVAKLTAENKTNETYKEFISATKDEQSKIKDVGGYVGGYLREGKRSPSNVVHRQILTLDIDFAHLDLWMDFCLMFDNAAILHATHKHCDTSPRYRLVMPLSRPVTPDEYAAIGRKVAGEIGIELFDNTTFETNRLMFWPSNPKDIEYYAEFQDGPWIDADGVLKMYQDWTDTSLWPTADRKINEINSHLKKQEDPELKRGLIGVFCRAYGITDAIEKFLTDVYSPTSFSDRFTFINGTAAAGLIVYEDKFAFSHHGTDPCGGKLCNAFDLVRIHLYGHLDKEDDSAKPKSFKAMEGLIINDDRVKQLIASESVKDAKYDFEPDDDTLNDDDLESEADNIDWMKALDVDAKGNYQSTSSNLNLIFQNDYRFKKIFRFNDFDNKPYVYGNLPWRKISKPEPIRNVDFAGIRNYIEAIYGITGNLKVEDALFLEFERNHFHPVKDYFKSLAWDGTKRVDNILIDYFGAEDNQYSREAIRKTLVGAVARIFNPGVKFDLVLTLVSSMQGTGKSSFLRALGRKWFSDSFNTVSGKESYEQLHGAWIIEMAELSGLKKAEIESIKHFITKQEDSFRPAYARTVETFQRQCIFVATTNENMFLRDPSGNRRFMPIDVANKKLTNNKDLMDFIQDDYSIDQIWAEAIALYKKGETLYLSPEAEEIATDEQHKHSEADERTGIVDRYLNLLLPDNWEDIDMFARREFVINPDIVKSSVKREFVCVAEIWSECLGKNREDMDRYKTRELNDILRGLTEWEQLKSPRNFKHYGLQKCYRRRKTSGEETRG